MLLLIHLVAGEEEARFDVQQLNYSAILHNILRGAAINLELSGSFRLRVRARVRVRVRVRVSDVLVRVKIRVKFYLILRFGRGESQ